MAQETEGTAGSRARRLLPFVVCGLVAFALVPLSGGVSVDWAMVATAFALSVAIGLAALFSPALSGRRYASLAAMAVLVAIALLRDGTGGARGGYGTVVLVPVLWVALYGSRAQLWQTLACVTLTFTIPLVAIGAPDYPATGWRSVPLLVLLCGLVGVVVQELLARERAVGTRLQQAHAELQQIAQTDPLTGLPNRRTLEATYAREIAVAERSERPLALAMIDLDRFKAYNDAHGHPAGDVLLRTVSDRWGRRLRATDVLTRWGGEEFCLLLPGCDANDAKTLIDSLRSAMPDEQTFSAGVVAWEPDMTGEQLIASADRALYRAKRDGRDRTVIAPREWPHAVAS